MPSQVPEQRSGGQSKRDGVKGGQLKARLPGQTRVEEEEGTAQQLHFPLAKGGSCGESQDPTSLPWQEVGETGRLCSPTQAGLRSAASGSLCGYSPSGEGIPLAPEGHFGTAPRAGQRRLEPHSSGPRRLLNWLASPGPCLEDYFAQVQSCPWLSHLQTVLLQKGERIQRSPTPVCPGDQLRPGVRGHPRGAR